MLIKNKIMELSSSNATSNTLQGKKIFVHMPGLKTVLVSLSFLTPVFLTLSFPKYDLSWLIWIALIPFFLALKRVNWLQSFILSWMIGMLTFMGIFLWINLVNQFSLIHYILGTLFMGLYFGLFGLLTRSFNNKKIYYPFLAALLWVCIEYLRSHFYFLSFPWALLGHTQYKNKNLIQISSFTGVYGISFFIVLVNASLAEFLATLLGFKKDGTEVKKGSYCLRFCLYLFPVLFTVLVSFLGKGMRKEYEKVGKIRLGLVQCNIPQEIKWKKEIISRTLGIYESFTKKAARDKPSLIVWPETSIPIDLSSYPIQMWRILKIAKQVRIPLICGAAGSPKIGQSGSQSQGIYNSAFYISPKGSNAGEYRKIRLLPFAEYIPSVWRFSFKTFFPELKGGFIPGRHIKTFPIDKECFGITICWENIFPDLFRRFVLKGATFMINISNDAWFEDSAGPYQHLMCNIFRAVENRISIARAANTGISCFIDPFGNIIQKVTDHRGYDLNVAGVVCGTIPLYMGPTFYTKYGDIFVFLCFALLGIYILIILIKSVIHIAVWKKYLEP